MYRILTHDEPRDTIAALPTVAALAYAEALGLLTLPPWRGGPFREDNPDGNIRTLAFGSGGLITYLILERDREVQWAG